MTEYEVTVTRAAARDMQSKKTPVYIIDAVMDLMEVLEWTPQRVGERLREPLEGLWSARRGDFRVIYVIDEEKAQVSIVAVKHRADSYRPHVSDR